MNRVKSLNKSGFTLMELIVVLVILAILTAIVIPFFSGYWKKAKQQVCRSNCLQLERMYNAYLVLESMEHSEAIFQQYLYEYRLNMCPEHGEITYVDGEVRCSIHSGEDVEEGKEDEVLYL